MNCKTYKVKVYPNGEKHWYDGDFHREKEDGPAIEYPDGTKAFYKNGKFCGKQ